MGNCILITGGSGLVGTRLTEILLKQGYQVAHLGRTRNSQKSVKSYIWNVKEEFIENEALESANIVVHLAGAGVADKRWTPKRKKEILQSRVHSTSLLHRKLKELTSPCEAFISASAVGIYGWDTGDSWIYEHEDPGKGFLAEVTKSWENEVLKLQELNLRVVMLRIGVVLSESGGALPKMAQTVRWNVGAALGSGSQYMSWIHIDDLCNMFIKAIADTRLKGAYNAVAPNPVTNRTFTRSIAEILNKPLWLPTVPSWALRLMLGEMAKMIVGGNRVSSKKIESLDFNYKFADVRPALESLLKKGK